MNTAAFEFGIPQTQHANKRGVSKCNAAPRQTETGRLADLWGTRTARAPNLLREIVLNKRMVRRDHRASRRRTRVCGDVAAVSHRQRGVGHTQGPAVPSGAQRSPECVACPEELTEFPRREIPSELRRIHAPTLFVEFDVPSHRGPCGARRFRDLVR